jgi:hypothetical protein
MRMDTRVKDITGKCFNQLTVIMHAGRQLHRDVALSMRLRQEVDRHRLGAAGRTHAIVRLRSHGRK